ncbi:MAG: IPT/TIG domain-containing protein [Acidobacteriota bacterium]
MRCLCWAILAFGIQSASAEFIITGPNPIRIPDYRRFDLIDHEGKNVKWRYTGVTPSVGNPPNFIVVVPTSGTTPSAVQIGLNPSVVSLMRPGSGNYSLTVHFTTVDQDPPKTVNGFVQFVMPPQPPPAIQSVVNTASLQPFISPGAMVSILGSYLAFASPWYLPTPTLSATYDVTASYPTTLGNTKVTFNGIAAPLLYVSPSQINGLVPYALAGQKSVEVVVNRFDVLSSAFTMPLLDTSPGIFTATQSGSGQAAIRQLGPDRTFSYNSADNPASPGTAFELYATGAGVWTPLPQSDINISLQPTAFTAQPVSLTIGGQPARVLYGGTVAYQEVWALLQVNAVVPDGVGSGPQPLVLRIGQNDNAQQNVTIAIR